MLCVCTESDKHILLNIEKMWISLCGDFYIFSISRFQKFHKKNIELSVSFILITVRHFLGFVYHFWKIYIFFNSAKTYKK